MNGWDSRLEEKRAVLFVSASGWLGGPGRSLLTLMANLPRSVDRILVSPTNGDLLEAIDARGVRVRHLPLFRRRGRIGVPLGRLTAITMLTLWIVRNRRGLVAIHANGFSELHLIALGAALSRVPVVAWFHGYQADPWDKRLGPVWRRLIANRSFVAVSELARDVVVATGLATPDQITIVPNPIDPRDVQAADHSNVGGSERRLPVVGYLGSTLRDKGFDLLPEIIEQTKGFPLTWALFLPKGSIRCAGDRKLWSRLERLSAAGRVSFPGRRSDVRDAYEECDIVICPSRRESFGRIAAEAMVNGLPVVASDIGPFRELLEGWGRHPVSRR